MKKKLLYIFSIFSILFTIGILINFIIISPLLGSDGIFMPDKTEIEKVLDKDYNYLLLVANYMNNYNCDYIRWEAIDKDNINYHYRESDGGYVTQKKGLVDIKLKSAIDKLKNDNFEYIIKTDRYIEFVKWNSLDSSCGIIYCDNSEFKEQDNLTSKNFILDELSKDNWYFYKYIDG